MYDPAVFPAILPGVSTNKWHQGNTKLLSRFFDGNIERFPGGVFVDMQGINDAEIGVGGEWHGFLLVPHGLVYRVVRAVQENDPASFFGETLAELAKLPDWSAVDVADKYVRGSWEYACMSVVNDGKYQAGLGFLTYGLEVSKHVGARPELLETYVGLMQTSSGILFGLVEERMGAAEIRQKAADVSRPPLSFSIADLTKNAALSLMKFYQSQDVFRRFKPSEHSRWAKQAGGDSFEQTAKKANAVVALHLADAGPEASEVFTHFQRDLEKRHGGEPGWRE